MAVRVSFQVELSISETTDSLNELGKTPPWKGKADVLDNGGTWRQRIAAGATDLEIDLNGLSNGRLLAIKTSQEITIKKNANTGEAWTIRPLGVGATEGIFVSTTDGITSLFVTNAGSLDAEVTFSLAGLV